MLGVFLDIEANGLNFFKHRVLEIAYKIVDLYDGRCLESYDEVVKQPREVWEVSDLESLKINGFTWDQILQGKPEEKIRQDILASFQVHHIKREKAVFICQNPSFDRSYFSQIIDPDLQESLEWPYHWLDLASMYYAHVMGRAQKEKSPYPWEVGFSKNTIAEDLELPLEDAPHRAINGVDHLILCYKNVISFPMSP